MKRTLTDLILTLVIAALVIAAILVMVVSLGGCNTGAAPPPRWKTLPATQKPRQKPPCRELSRKIGKHCAVIVARCEAQGVTAMIVGIAVKPNKDRGRAAATEAADILFTIFGGPPPNLFPLAVDESGPVKFYLFAITAD